MNSLRVAKQKIPSTTITVPVPALERRIAAPKKRKPAAVAAPKKRKTTPSSSSSSRSTSEEVEIKITGDVERKKVPSPAQKKAQSKFAKAKKLASKEYKKQMKEYEAGSRKKKPKWSVVSAQFPL